MILIYSRTEICVGEGERLFNGGIDKEEAKRALFTGFNILYTIYINVHRDRSYEYSGGFNLLIGSALRRVRSAPGESRRRAPAVDSARGALPPLAQRPWRGRLLGNLCTAQVTVHRQRSPPTRSRHHRSFPNGPGRWRPRGRGSSARPL